MTFEDWNVNLPANTKAFSKIIIDRCTFEGTNAPDVSSWGYSAMVFRHLKPGSAYTISITDTEFKDQLGLAGSAVSFKDLGQSTVTIRGCSFLNNKAHSSSSGIAAGGGALNFMNLKGNSNVTISHCDFKGNRASGTGGGGAISAADTSNITVTDCRFEDNLSSSNGGAMVVERVDAATVSDSSFTNNFASMLGGSIFGSSVSPRGAGELDSEAEMRDVSGRGLMVTRCLFNGSSSSAGGAVFATDTIFTGETNTFTGNAADESGNAMTVTGVWSVVRDQGSIFERNSNPGNAGNGGALSLSDAHGVFLVKTVIRNNANGIGGGLVLFNIDRSKLTGVLCEGNFAQLSGGCIAASASKAYSAQSTLTIDGGSVIEGNEALLSGGGVYAGGPLKITVSSSSFLGNTAVRGGAVALTKGSSLSMGNTGSVFKGN